MNLEPMHGNLEGAFHLMPPFIPYLLGAAVIGLFLWVFLARIWPWWKSRPQPPAPPAPAKATDLAHDLAALEKEVLMTKAYRGGIFQMNALVKARLKAATGKPVTERASPELTAWPDTAEQAATIAHLEAVACGKREPDLKDFRACLADAKQVVEQVKRGRP